MFALTQPLQIARNTTCHLAAAMNSTKGTALLNMGVPVRSGARSCAHNDVRSYASQTDPLNPPTPGKPIQDWLIKARSKGINQYTRLQSMPDRTILWKARKTEQAPPVYLYGSVHQTDLNHFPLKKSVERAITKSDVLALEVIPSSDERELSPSVRSFLSIKFKDIWSDISDETKDRLRHFYEAVTGNNDFDEIQNHSIYDAVSIMNEICFHMLGGRMQSMENEMIELFKNNKDNPQLLSLETKESREFYHQHYSPLETKDYCQILDMIAKSFNGYVDTIVALQSIRRLSLPAILVPEQQREKQNSEGMRFRNETMVKTLEDWQQKNPESSCFSVVGAAHLLDQWNMVSMLKEKGWIIEYNNQVD